MLSLRLGARPQAFAVALGLLLYLSALLPAADRAWIEVKSPNFTAISEVGEAPAREMLWNFEQLRAAIHKVWPWAGVDYDRPIVLILPRGEDGMRQLLPGLAERKITVTPTSTFVSAVDRHYAVLRTDAPQDSAKNINPYRVAFSSYVGLALRTGIARDLPLWIRDGLMSVVSNTYMRDTYVDIGRMDTLQLQHVRKGGRLPLGELVATTSTKDWEQAKVRMLYPQSGTFAHYLLFGDDGAHRDDLSRFLQLVTEGKTSSAAFELAFGDTAKVSAGFERYLNRPAFTFLHLPVDTSISREAFTVRTLLPSDGASVRAGYLAGARRPVEARAELAEARAHMAGAAPFEVEGVLFDTDRDGEKALTAYTKAVELGSTNFYAYYRKAVLTSTPDPPSRLQREELLQRAVELSPRFVPALLLLAETKSSLGKANEALTLARRAAMLDPGLVSARMILARVMWALELRDDAINQLREAVALAHNDGERNLAQTTLDNYLKAKAR